MAVSYDCRLCPIKECGPNHECPDYARVTWRRLWSGLDWEHRHAIKWMSLGALLGVILFCTWW